MYINQINTHVAHSNASQVLHDLWELMLPRTSWPTHLTLFALSHVLDAPIAMLPVFVTNDRRLRRDLDFNAFPRGELHLTYHPILRGQLCQPLQGPIFLVAGCSYDHYLTAVPKNPAKVRMPNVGPLFAATVQTALPSRLVALPNFSESEFAIPMWS